MGGDCDRWTRHAVKLLIHCCLQDPHHACSHHGQQIVVQKHHVEIVKIFNGYPRPPQKHGSPKLAILTLLESKCKMTGSLKFFINESVIYIK